uniref:Coiled-coil domain containing 187 n=1 Tax=Molossus molossus TaxID=27622 RepID=A0A7J8ED35_MOLMO|nr:coiled-coil domain containing 187 [Molossus molossus]
MSTCPGTRTQPHPKGGQSHCPLSLGAPWRSAAQAGTAPRAGKPHPPIAEDDLMAALRWPRPSKQPDAPQGTPYVVWSDHLQRPGPPGQTCSCPIWAACEQSKDGDSSVSSGRLSGSSGGHKSCAPPHKPWKERPSQWLGSPRQHRKSSPRLELLRDRIRAQAHGQASCASLGTSLPSSASHTLGASAPAPQRKVRRLKKPPPTPAYPDSGDLSAAELGAADKASAGQECEPSGVSQRQASVRREKTKSTRSRSCRREKAPTWSPSRAAKDKDEVGPGTLTGHLGTSSISTD